MKVIVVEDDDTKFGAISEVLDRATKCALSVIRCEDGLTARESLARDEFDLLVIDLLLPFRSGEIQDQKGGMNLLTEIVRTSRLSKPGHVLALTGYTNLRAEFEAKFNYGAWGVDTYDPGDLGWRERLQARVAYIESSLASTGRFDKDHLVIAALRDPELAAVRRLNWNWSAAEALDDATYMYSATTGNGQSVVAVAADRMGPVATSIVATKAIAVLKPRLVTMTGICGGVKGKADLGDIVVSSPTWDWQMGKALKEKFEIDPDQISVDVTLASKISLLAEDDAFLAGIWSSFEGEKPRSVPKLCVAPMAAGSCVVADDRMISSIREQNRKTRAIDMESYALCAAARSAATPRPKSLVIKAVCDFGNSEKDDRLQAYCAYASARVFEELVVRFGDELF